MSAVLVWLKKWGAWLLGGLVLVLTLGLVGRRVARKLGKLRDEAALAEATAEVRQLEGARAEVARQRGEEDLAVRELDRRIREQKRAAVTAYEGGEGLSDDELEDAFREALGG